jgi:hypothetical protein
VLAPVAASANEILGPRARVWRASVWDVGSDRRRAWLFDQATRRVACVDGVVAEYATSICTRAMRRRAELLPEADGRLGRVTWSIDHEVVVEFTAVSSGPHRVTVHDIGLLHPLRQTLRNRHLVVEHRSR